MRRAALFGGLVVATALMAVLDLTLGRGVEFGRFLEALSDLDDTPRRILVVVRLPRVLTALLVGAALGTAGHVVQTALRNRLASPEMIGVNPAAVVGIIIGLWTGAVAVDNPVAMLVAALVGGLAGGSVAWLLGHATDAAGLVVAGMLLSAALGGVTILFLSTRASGLGNVFRWIIGSTDGRVWSQLAVAAPWILGGVAVLIACSGVLFLLEGGDDHAGAMGLPAGAVRGAVLLAAIATVAGSVALAGAITFVGLLVPHVTRRLVGVSPRWGLPYSAVIGALLMVACDALAQALTAVFTVTQIADRFGVPTGAMTALLGAIALIWVARRETAT